MSSPNRIARRALMRDALAQVLDNKVFRILLILTLVLIAIPLVIGFRPDEVVILFGLKSYAYADLPGLFMLDIGEDQQRQAIERLQDFFVRGLAGTFGLLFCIAATSFFVPRMLEKGAADPLFSKPVSRFSLLLSRYVASVLFIAILACVLVGGIYVGLLLHSGYSPADFLWSAPRLIYQFALIASVSALVGTWTRSNTAALLLTFVFYGLCTGVHNGWIIKEFAVKQPEYEMLTEVGSAGADPQVADEVDAFTAVLGTALDATHYVLPKTHDAERIERLLRDQLELVLDSDRGSVAISVRGTPVLVRRVGKSNISVESSNGTNFTSGDEGGPWTIRVRRRELEVRVPEDGGLEVYQDGERLEEIDPAVIAEIGYDPFSWYDAKFGWGSELPFNAWFSILSSLAFVAAALGLAWLKLRRISF